MKLSSAELDYCLGKAREISSQYELAHIGSDDPVRSIDNLMETCKTYLRVKINLYEIDIDQADSAVWAACIKTEKGFDLCIAKGHNFCWQRFTLCKELFHVILDKPEYRNMDLCGHITEVTVAFPDHGSTPTTPVAAEILAEISAMEFMFPYKRRLQEIDGPSNGNFRAIAEKYRVPQVYVERYLSDSYMAALKEYS